MDDFGDGNYDQFGKKIPFGESDYDSDDELYDHTYQSIPPVLEYKGTIYR